MISSNRVCDHQRLHDWLSSRNFFREGAKSIVMQIYFVMLIFLLFSDQISGAAKCPRGENYLRGRPLSPCGRKPAY